MTLIIALLIFIPKVGIGFVIAHLVWNDSRISALLLKTSIGVPLGFAISASLFFVALLVGVTPAIYSWFEFTGFLLVVIFLSVLFVRKKRFLIPKPSWQDVLGGSIVLLSAFLFFCVLWFYFRTHPNGFEDAWTIWNFTSRFIYRGNSPDILFYSQFYERFHPDYPVELSLNVAWGWFILGNETPYIPMAVAILSTFPACIFFWSILRMWKGVVSATVGAVLILITSHLPSIIGQYADPLFTLHIFATLAVFYWYLKSSENKLLILCGLLGGFSAWVKNEGILFIGVFSVVCLLAAWRKTIGWKAFRFMISGMIFPIFIVFLYKLMVTWQNDLMMGTNSTFNQVLDPSRWAIIAKNFALYIMSYSGWPLSIVFVLFIYAFMVGFDPKDTSHQIILLFVVMGQFTGYFFIYLITPHGLQMHIQTSMNRLVSHIFPLIILWLFVTLRSPSLVNEPVDSYV